MNISSITYTLFYLKSSTIFYQNVPGILTQKLLSIPQIIRSKFFLFWGPIFKIALVLGLLIGSIKICSVSNTIKIIFTIWPKFNVSHH